MNLCTLFFYSLFLCSLLLPAPALAQTQTAQRLILVETDTSKAPTVTFHLGAFDKRGQPIRDLQPQEISLSIDGQPLTTTLKLEREQRPPAVVFVADTSFAMNDAGTPMNDRAQEMVNQIKRTLELLPPETPVTLITFNTQAQVAEEWRADGTSLFARLDALANQPLPAAVPDTPYALADGIRMGLEQFNQTNELIANRPRAMFVYAAGVPEHTVDANLITASLDNLAPNMPAITVVGMGSGTPGEFLTQPGNPESLRQLAQAMSGATFLPSFTTDVNAVGGLQNALDLQVKTVVDMEHLYVVTAPIETLPPGSHRIEIKLHDLTANTVIRLTATPPQLSVRTPDGPLQGRVPLSVDVAFAQRPIEEVSYLLNDQPVGSSTAEPDFAFELDVDSLYQSQTPPEPGKPANLVAVATDVDGQEGRSNAVKLQLQAPTLTPQPPTPSAASDSALQPLIIALVVVGILLLFAIIGLAIILLRRQTPSSGGETIAPQNNRGRFGNLSSNATMKQGGFVPAQTLLAMSTKSAGGMTAGEAQIAIIEGDKRQMYSLQNGGSLLIGRGAGHEVALNNDRVSRQHARLTGIAGGIQITDLGSTNGTFVGKQKRRLTANETESLSIGDNFWIGPEVRLVVMSGGGDMSGQKTRK
jgi:uncharacterized membrane protein